MSDRVYIPMRWCEHSHLYTNSLWDILELLWVICSVLDQTYVFGREVVFRCRIVWCMFYRCHLAIYLEALLWLWFIINLNIVLCQNLCWCFILVLRSINSFCFICFYVFSGCDGDSVFEIIKNYYLKFPWKCGRLKVTLQMYLYAKIDNNYASVRTMLFYFLLRNYA